MDLPDLMNSQCLIWYRPCYFPQSFTRAVHRCVFSPSYDGLTDFPYSMDWWTCLIWWTDRHVWFYGLTDMTDLMDWQTCLIWWTKRRAWFDGQMDMPDLMNSVPDLILTLLFPSNIHQSGTSMRLFPLVWWTDGFPKFNGLTDMTDLIDMPDLMN